MKMKALVWSKENKLQLVETERPAIESDSDVLIKIKYSGICGTDLQVLKGNETIVPDIILGHEAIGEVVEVGKDVSEYKKGDMVIIDPNQYCCDCEYCKRGLTNFCTGYNGGLKIAGINVHGVFAEYFCCHKRYLYKIPEGMSNECAVLVEPMTCVLNNIRAAGIKENESVLVMGSGPMGALCQMIAHRRGAKVAASEGSKYRKEQVKAWCDYVLSPEEVTEDRVREINNGRLFDVIIDTVGNQLENAIALVEKHGRIIPMGMNKVFEASVKPYTFINKGISLIGASEYNMLFTDTIEMLSSYDNVGDLLTHTYKIEDYKEAFNQILGYDMDTREQREIQAMKVAFEF